MLTKNAKKIEDLLAQEQKYPETTRETVTLVAGQGVLTMGRVLRLDTGGYRALSNSNTVAEYGQASAILLSNADTTSGSAEAVALVRGSALVVKKAIDFATTDDNRINAAINALMAKNIVVKDTEKVIEY
jgi:hypothetical protein